MKDAREVARRLAAFDAVTALLARKGAVKRSAIAAALATPAPSTPQPAPGVAVVATVEETV